MEDRTMDEKHLADNITILTTPEYWQLVLYYSKAHHAVQNSLYLDQMDQLLLKKWITAQNVMLIT